MEIFATKCMAFSSYNVFYTAVCINGIGNLNPKTKAETDFSLLFKYAPLIPSPKAMITHLHIAIKIGDHFKKQSLNDPFF